MNTEQVTLHSLDGTRLAANLYSSPHASASALLVHGIMSEKTEGGLFESLALALAARDCTSLAVDLRSHGDSEGDQTEFTLAGALTDIVSASRYLDELLPDTLRTVVAASFGGGISLYASQNLIRASRLVLINPRLSYSPWIADSTLFRDGDIDPRTQQALHDDGYCERRGFRIGRALANELATWKCDESLRLLAHPTLVLHGTADSVIPIASSRTAFADNHMATLIEVDDAQHGFTDPKTDDPSTEKSMQLRANVVETIVSWMMDERVDSD